MTPTDNKAIVSRYMDAYERGDRAVVLSCLANDVEWIVPGAFHLHGRDAFSKEIDNPAFIGLPTITVSSLTAENDVVVAEGAVRTQRRDGVMLHLAYCDVFELQAGAIRKLTSYLMELRDSTGAASAPPSDAARFSANNELALHVPDPEAAERFYVDVLGCAVTERLPDCISLTSGALRLYLLRDPVLSHEPVIPSFDVPNRDAAVSRLVAAGCTLVPIGPHAPGGHYVRDPFGILFDVVERNTQ